MRASAAMGAAVLSMTYSREPAGPMWAWNESDAAAGTRRAGGDTAPG